MADSGERRKRDRRQAPIRSGKDRRNPDLPPMPGSTRSGQDRRQLDRRKGIDRRMTRTS